jgi:hypothetical protein
MLRLPSWKSLDEAIPDFAAHYESHPARWEPTDQAGLVIIGPTAGRAIRYSKTDFGGLDVKQDRPGVVPHFEIVNSSLTSMVQMVDLCAYALRRFVENQETDLFNRIFQRADRAGGGYTVGVRHFAGLTCRCQICVSHT